MLRAAGEGGLRRGELIALKWGDVDFEGRRLHVRRSIWQEHAGLGRGRRIEKPTNGRRRGLGPTDRLQPWLAAFGRRLGHPAAVLPPARLSRRRPRPAGARALHPDRRRSRHGPLRRRPGCADCASRSPGMPSTSGTPPVVAKSCTTSPDTGRAVWRKRFSSVRCRPSWCRPTPTPAACPKSVFDGFQAQVAANRSEFYRALAVGPLNGFNRAGRGTLGGHHRELVAPGDDGRSEGLLRRHRRFSQTDFTEDLKKIRVPVL